MELWGEALEAKSSWWDQVTDMACGGHEVEPQL